MAATSQQEIAQRIRDMGHDPEESVTGLGVCIICHELTQHLHSALNETRDALSEKQHRHRRLEQRDAGRVSQAPRRDRRGRAEDLFRD